MTQDKKISCPLCSSEFTEEEAKKECASACRKICGSCGMLSCPNCGYRIPKPSGIAAWVEGILTKTSRKDNHYSHRSENR